MDDVDTLHIKRIALNTCIGSSLYKYRGYITK
jgi:hypothetical protein